MNLNPLVGYVQNAPEHGEQAVKKEGYQGCHPFGTVLERVEAVRNGFSFMQFEGRTKLAWTHADFLDDAKFCLIRARHSPYPNLQVEILGRECEEVGIYMEEESAVYTSA